MSNNLSPGGSPSPNSELLELHQNRRSAQSSRSSSPVAISQSSRNSSSSNTSYERASAPSSTTSDRRQLQARPSKRRRRSSHSHHTVRAFATAHPLFSIEESRSQSFDSPIFDIERRNETHILDLPIKVTKRILEYVLLEDLNSCMCTCSAWFNLLSEDGSGTEHPIWKRHCSALMDAEVLDAPYLQGCRTLKTKLRALLHSWNPFDCSPNGKVHAFTFVRNQVPQTTDGCRARIGFREGKHVWQIIWQQPLGSNACIGVATRSTVLINEGYVPLIGNDRHSWGWNIVDNTAMHNGRPVSYYPPDPKIKYQTGDIIYVLLDCDNGTLSFNKNGEYLGIAFINLPVPRKELFPAVSAVYGGTKVILVYLGQLHETRIEFPKF